MKHERGECREVQQGNATKLTTHGHARTQVYLLKQCTEMLPIWVQNTLCSELTSKTHPIIRSQWVTTSPFEDHLLETLCKSKIKMNFWTVLCYLPLLHNL